MVVLLFGLVALAAYGWSLSGAFLNWDDPTYVLDNPELRDAGGLGSIFTTFHFANYNPLQRLSYWVEWQLAADSAWLFRLTNLLLHVGNAVLLFELLREWLGRNRAGVALVGAALFLVHPSNVETVAWISERKSLLATAFAFGATLCWLRGRRGVAFALFVLGMLSKTSIVPLPLFLLALDVAARRSVRENFGWYVAMAVPAVALGLAQVAAADAAGAVRGLHGGGAAAHVATVIAVLPHYAFHLLLPFWLTPRHAFEPATFGDPRLWAGVATLVAVGVGVVRSWRGERRFAVAAIWALGALLVTMVVPIPILLADRYWYFAMPLLLGVAVDGASRLSLPRAWLTTAAAALVTAGCAATIDYARVWRNSTALWSHAIRRTPTDVDAWISLGAARNADNDLPGAMLAYDRAIALSPTNAEAIESLANVELQIGRIGAARDRLAALVAREPARVQASLMLAACHDLAGDTRKAKAEFERLLARHGGNADARRALATFLERHPELASAFSDAAPGR